MTGDDCEIEVQGVFMDRRSFLKLLSATPFVGAMFQHLNSSRFELLRSISIRIDNSVKWVIGRDVIWYKNYFPGVK